MGHKLYVRNGAKHINQQSDKFNWLERNNQGGTEYSKKSKSWSKTAQQQKGTKLLSILNQGKYEDEPEASPVVMSL